VSADVERDLPVAGGAAGFRRVPGTTVETARPFVVGIGGTTRPGSSSERALERALAAAEGAGAETLLLPAAELEFPMYAPERATLTDAAARFVEAVERSDGLVIASPGYHGSISGLLKNALDYTEELRERPRPYIDGRAVGCIVCAQGAQAGTTTLMALRSIVHALRGWPTPLGVAINTTPRAEGGGGLDDPGVLEQLEIVGRQVTEFARWRAELAVGAS
jgi:FMN reductase